MPIKKFKTVGKTGKVRAGFDVTVCVRGQRIHRQLLDAEATQKNAEALEAQLKQGLFDRVVLGKKPEAPLSVALDKYVKEQVYGKVTGRPHKSAQKTAGLVGLLAPWIVGRGITEVVDVAREMTDDMLSAGRKPAVINRRLSILRRVAHLALTDWDMLDTAIWEKIRPLAGEKVKRTRMSIKEVWDVIDALEYQEVKDMTLVSLLTGFRLEECERILAQDRWAGPPEARVWVLGYKVDWERNVIILPDQKNDEYSWHPLLPQAIAPIQRSFPFEFCSRSGLQKMIRRACDKIGREDCSFHTLRKSTGSILLDLEVPLSVVSQILRHKTLEVTAKAYGFMNVTTKRVALQKLDDAFARPAPLLIGDSRDERATDTND